jgi:hypothetical protein
MRRAAAAILLIAGVSAFAAELPVRRAGAYQVALRLPESGLIAGEEMQIEFRISDATESDPVLGPLPIVRASVETTIDMPEMASMPKAKEIAHPEGVPGDYGIHPTFPHGGAYRLTMNIARPGAPVVSVEFPLEVQDRGAVATRKAPVRFGLDVASQPKSPKAGEPATLQLTVRDRGGLASDFEIVHEKPMHLIVVSKDLGYFRHEHPQPSGDGRFEWTHTFPRPGVYHLFVDVAPRAAGSQILFGTIKVNGKRTPVNEESTSAATSHVELSPSAIESKRTSVVVAAIHDRITSAAVTDLENYLGARAHLMLIHEDAVTFVHSHPDERAATTRQDGVVPFLVRLPKPGRYKAWLQFMRSGVLNTVELAVEGR